MNIGTDFQCIFCCFVLLDLHLHSWQIHKIGDFRAPYYLQYSSCRLWLRNLLEGKSTKRNVTITRKYVKNIGGLGTSCVFYYHLFFVCSMYIRLCSPVLGSTTPFYLVSLLFQDSWSHITQRRTTDKTKKWFLARECNHKNTLSNLNSE